MYECDWSSSPVAGQLAGTGEIETVDVGWTPSDPTISVLGFTALVAADRCACEVKNPQGSCCLGNVAEATKSARATLEAGAEAAPHHA